MLIGREGKLDSMEKNWSSAGAKFVVVYGNHKSGKTSVLSEFSENKRGILFSAEHLNSFMNLRLFEKAVSEFSGEEEDFPTWKVAFKRIADFAKDERFLLAIDDFADLVFEDRTILKDFRNAFENEWRNSNIFVVAGCGRVFFTENEITAENSAASMRRPIIYKLEELDYLDSAKLLPKGTSAADKMRYYCCLGGIPEYLKLVEGDKTFEENIRNILADKDYIVDSLIITASCSPEGSYIMNNHLAELRAESIKEYFREYVNSYSDSLNNRFWEISLLPEDENSADGEGEDAFNEKMSNSVRLQDKIGTRWIAEGWDELYNLIKRETNIADRDYIDSCMSISNYDDRERAILNSPDGRYIKEVLYPYLRCVKFDFYMHRRGMIKDTVHTREIDTLYMQGVEALQERDYKKAVTLLRPYRDLNSALAFICMDYNNSALEILKELPQSAACNYMQSVVYARMGREDWAVQHFIRSVEQDPAMRHRGNLDPEISSLLKKYHVLNSLKNSCTIK